MKKTTYLCGGEKDRDHTATPVSACQQSFERILNAVERLSERIDRLEMAQYKQRPLARQDDCEAATVLILGEEPH
ncbi:MAG: hypothetical protein ACUVX8_15115 [Candidatus Zipacnadales bacterium]